MSLAMKWHSDREKEIRRKEPAEKKRWSLSFLLISGMEETK